MKDGGRTGVWVAAGAMAAAVLLVYTRLNDQLHFPPSARDGAQFLDSFFPEVAATGVGVFVALQLERQVARAARNRDLRGERLRLLQALLALRTYWDRYEASLHQMTEELAARRVVPVPRVPSAAWRVYESRIRDSTAFDDVKVELQTLHDQLEMVEESFALYRDARLAELTSDEGGRLGEVAEGLRERLVRALHDDVFPSLDRARRRLLTEIDRLERDLKPRPSSAAESTPTASAPDSREKSDRVPDDDDESSS